MIDKYHLKITLDDGTTYRGDSLPKDVINHSFKNLGGSEFYRVNNYIKVRTSLIMSVEVIDEAFERELGDSGEVW